jgi:hypothetical protein
MARKTEHGSVVVSRGTREVIARYRGASEDRTRPLNQFAEGYRLGVAVALECAHEALLHGSHGEALADGTWARRRASKLALGDHLEPRPDVDAELPADVRPGSAEAIA